MAITTISGLIIAARNGQSQVQFAQELGIKQSSVSRYENGSVNPPVSVIEHCMRLVHKRTDDSLPTAEELAAKVKSELSDESLGQIRLALSKIIDGFASENNRLRN